MCEFEWQPLTGSLTNLLVQVVLAGFRSRFLCQARRPLHVPSHCESGSDPTACCTGVFQRTPYVESGLERDLGTGA